MIDISHQVFVPMAQCGVRKRAEKELEKDES